MAGLRLWFAVVALGWIAVQISAYSGLPSAQAEDADAETDLAPHYGFEAIEIFKLEERSHSLLAGDLNNDGLTDVLSVDNSHSRLDLLQQRAEKPDTAEKSSGTGRANAVENDWRFEHRKIPLDKQVESLALGDFNGDGRTDIACFAVPDQLIVRFQPESGDWTEQTSFRLPDVPARQWNVAAGDLNSDGRDDLAVLGQYETYIVSQQEDGTLAPPTRLLNTSEKLALAQIRDLDGDGRNDLVYVADDGGERVLAARFQREAGQLGPELRFELGRTRAMSLSNIDGQPAAELLTIDNQTGRVEVLELKHADSESPDSTDLPARLIQFGFGRQASGRDRDLATGDVDGDGLTDVVVTDPEAAQIVLFRQFKERGLDLGTPYPGLMGAHHVRLTDFDDDGAAEIVVLSNDEKTIGISRFEEGRVTFPQPLPAAAEDPMVVETADLNGDGRDELLYVSRQREGRTSSYALQALQYGDDGNWTPYLFDDRQSIELELRGTPNRLSQLDANGDGRPDFLIFLDLERAPHLYVMGENGVPAEVKAERGIRLGEISPGAVFIETRQEPVVLVAQSNFARRLQIDEAGRWRVVDQYNAAESKARIVGVAMIDLDGQNGREVVLIDEGIRKLRILREEEGLFRPWKEVDTGEFPHEHTHVADLNNDGKDDLLLFGRGKFAVLYAGRKDPALEEILTFETKLEETYFADLTAGDLNGDGQTDIAVVDTRSHYLEIVNYDQEAGLRHALHFKVFEAKSLLGSDLGTGEPREVLIADVTNDGRADLVLLSHDRMLVYPQDDGK